MVSVIQFVPGLPALKHQNNTTLETEEIISTNELLHAVRLHNKQAFAELYNRFAGILKGLIVKITNDYSIADDLLQDVFIRIWRNIETYDESKGSFLTWSVRITRNTITDYYRSKNYKQQQIQKPVSDELYKLSAAGAEPASASEAMGLVYKLDPKYRVLVEMIYIYGYTQEEVSGLMGLPLGTVKTRSRTAIQLLRSMMELQ
ncbi:MAG TPA: RNA polymerase sigma factor [Panacibacter sp.]|nr:RNA polymerase sigma factor [Panacibacter sp.]HNP46199.1 RNA polymerase sigma factor [Panacibacter sp.]